MIPRDIIIQHNFTLQRNEIPIFIGDKFSCNTWCTGGHVEPSNLNYNVLICTYPLIIKGKIVNVIPKIPQHSRGTSLILTPEDRTKCILKVSITEIKQTNCQYHRGLLMKEFLKIQFDK